MGTLDPWIGSSTGDGYRNSVVALPGDGSKTSFDFNFGGGYLDKSHIKAYTYDTSNGRTQTVPFSWLGPNTIQVLPAPAKGIHVVIYRDTPKSKPLVDFSTNASMTEKNLDMVTQQAIFAAAEMADRFDAINAGSTDAIERSIVAVNTANDAKAQAASAVGIANAATATANAAAASAGNAVSTANSANATANSASAVANGIDSKAQRALDNSVGATNIATNAQSVANGIDAKATQAMNQSSQALAQADGRKDGTFVSYQTGMSYGGLSIYRGTRVNPGDLAWSLRGGQTDDPDNLYLLHYAPGTVWDWSGLVLNYKGGKSVEVANAAFVFSHAEPSKQAQFTMAGRDASTGPEHKVHIRINQRAKSLEFVNNSYSAVIAEIYDDGLVVGKAGFHANDRTIQHVGNPQGPLDAVNLQTLNAYTGPGKNGNGNRYIRYGSNPGPSDGADGDIWYVV